MKKLLLRLSTVILGLGLLGAAACSGCSPSNTNNNNSSTMSQQSMSCGAYTHRVGNQCVGDTVGTTSTRPGASTLNTQGNN